MTSYDCEYGDPVAWFGSACRQVVGGGLLQVQQSSQFPSYSSLCSIRNHFLCKSLANRRSVFKLIARY